MARKRDLAAFRQRFNALLRLKPAGQPAQLVYTLAGMVGAAGLNDEGIGIKRFALDMRPAGGDAHARGSDLRPALQRLLHGCRTPGAMHAGDLEVKLPGGVGGRAIRGGGGHGAILRGRQPVLLRTVSGFACLGPPDGR